MLEGNKRLFGFNLPATLFYTILIIGFLMVVKVFNVISATVKKILAYFGFGDDEDKPDAQESNQKEIAKGLENNPGVKSQMIVKNRQKAEDIYNAISGWGVDMDALVATFKSITGPNQMGAVHLFYGIRTVTVIPMWHTGDLKSTLKWRLTDGQFKKISPYLNQLNQIK